MKTKAPRLPKISLRIVREPLKDYEPAQFHQPSDIYKFLRYMRELPEEKFVAIHLNTNHQPIALQEISHGNLNSSIVHPREVFKAALLNNAFAIVVAHNHPSGARLKPSPEDLKTTEQLIEAGKLLGVPVVDHLIIGTKEDEFLSIREDYGHYWA